MKLWEIFSVTKFQIKENSVYLRHHTLKIQSDPYSALNNDFKVDSYRKLHIEF